MDREILFWTEFWNQVFQPKAKLDPNTVKALIASESSFDLKPPAQDAGRAGKAIGLIQLTTEAIAALNADQGEIKDYRIKFNEANLLNSNVSIAAGIRWLFHKKSLASSLLKHEATWNEALINYKGYLKDYRRNRKAKLRGMEKFRERYNELVR